MNRRCANTLTRFLAAALLLAATSAWSAAYRWTDADGNVQYGDQPPTGAAAERVRVPGPPALPDEASQEAAGTPAEVVVEGDEKPVDISVTGNGQPDQSEASQEALRVEQERQKIEQQNAEIARRNAANKKANCAAARSNLERLKLNRPTRVYDEKSPSYRGRRLSAEERDQAMREAQKQIRENCN